MNTLNEYILLLVLMYCQKITWKEVGDLVAFQCTHNVPVKTWNVFNSCSQLLEVH